MSRYQTKRAVCAHVIFDDKIMLTQRKKVGTWMGYWANVGGSVEPNEFLIDAMVREMREETSLRLPQTAFEIVDCYQEGEFKCFIFECILPFEFFKRIKNTEPQKHADWQLFTLEEAVKLPKLMPSLQKYFQNLIDIKANN